MPTVAVNGIGIWYERSHGDGPALVLTHGFAGPTGGWPPVIEDLKRDFDLVLYDVRAHGRTGMPADPATVTMRQFAADLAGLIDALGLDRPHVGGVSMGGMITAQFGCDFPGVARSLLLCDTLAGNMGGDDPDALAVERVVAGAFERTAAIVEKHGLEELVRREDRYTREHDRYAHLQIWTLDEQAERNRARKAGMMTREGFIAAARAVREREDLTSRLPDLTLPVLISCGEWDLFYPCARRDAALIPNRRFVTIREAAHATPDYQPGLWRQAVRDFIRDVEAGVDVRGDAVLSPPDGAPRT
ncbi:MAG TPA: alpha/beta hydrolase [Dehalococcoidia bacterium]|nr:alpha/beta hydrolase [Dehalococcoidia bacterium]